MPLPVNYPPFGFTVWYDRHRGRRWCWRERNPVGLDKDDVIEDGGHRSKNHAIQSIRDELRRRGTRDAVALDMQLLDDEESR